MKCLIAHSKEQVRTASRDGGDRLFKGACFLLLTLFEVQHPGNFNEQQSI